MKLREHVGLGEGCGELLHFYQRLMAYISTPFFRVDDDDDDDRWGFQRMKEAKIMRLFVDCNTNAVCWTIPIAICIRFKLDFDTFGVDRQCNGCILYIIYF